MRYEIKFGIEFDRDNMPMHRGIVNAMVKEIMREACREFGGCDLLHGQGASLDDSGKLAYEESRTLVVDTGSRNSTDLSAEYLRKARLLAEFIRTALNQSAVHLTQVVGVSEDVKKSNTVAA